MTEAEFWASAERGEGCWEWRRAISPGTGYGAVRWDGKTQSAHRLAYKFSFGPIPEGKFVLHTCDNRKCVNPAHLVVGDHRENMRQMMERGRYGFRAMPRGEKNKNTRLSEAEMRGVRFLAGAGFDQRWIAKQYGIAQTTVSAIHRRANWAWAA